MTFFDPGTVIGRLESIETDLAKKQNEYEKAAGDRARLIRDWDKRMAICQVTHSVGPDAAQRKANALKTAIAEDDLYDRLTDAESSYAALHAAIANLEKRASIAQSVLRSQGRA